MADLTLTNIQGGIVLGELPYQIDDLQSSDMLNLWYNDKVLNKRWGQYTAVNSLNNRTYSWYQNTYKNYGVLHAGDSLYKYDLTNDTTSLITNGIATNKGTFFPYDDDLYYKDGAKYWVINSNFAVSEVVPYAPIVLTGCTPNLNSSTTYESYNLIGAGFTVWYNADGTNVYTLPQTNIDATNVTATVNGTNFEETTHFTVDRTNGKLTWLTNYIPTNGGVLNGVRITAYKTNTTEKNKIMKCLLAIPFGGESSSTDGGTRIFVSGNSDYPLTYWKSGLKDPTYFPDTEDENLDNNGQPITAFGKQYGELVVFKERSIYAIKYNFDGTNVTYPTRELNANIGCDMRKSIQLIDNRLVFFNTYKGGFIIDNTLREDERNIKPISKNINGTIISEGILQETISDLQNCTSVDYGRKYWLNIGSNVYLWDYDISPYSNLGDDYQTQKKLSWFKFDNIKSGEFFGGGQNLLYGRYDEGSITKFYETFADYGQAINGYWYSKAFDFKLPYWLKTVREVYLGLRTDTNTQVTIEYFDEKNEKIDNKVISVGTFSWEVFSWEVFSWQLIRYAYHIRRRPKRKKIVYFTIKLSNNQLNRDLGIVDITMVYDVLRRIK